MSKAADLFVWGIDAGVSGGAVAVARLEIRAPGSIAIKSANDASLAYLERDDPALIDLGLYGQFYGYEPWGEPTDRDDRKRLRRIFDCWMALRAHRHGGPILVVGQEDDLGGELLECPYRLSHPFKDAAAADAEIRELRKAGVDTSWHEQRRQRFTALIGRTTGIDGAAVIDAEGFLLGFGAKIKRLDPPKRLRRRRPAQGDVYEEIGVGQLGGMRHQSAAAFVASDPKFKAIVASQDGRLSMFVSKDRGEVMCLEHADWLL